MNDRVASMLFARMATGDQTALSALYHLTVDRVYRIAIEIVKTNEAARSVVCDTYVLAWQSAANLQNKGHAGIIWLLEIAKSLGLASVKDRRDLLGLVVLG